MSKPPGKRGGRGKDSTGKPGKPAGHSNKPGAARSRKPAASGRPPWMPESPSTAPSRGGHRPQPSSRLPRQPDSDPHARREAERYADPIASREMILQVLAASDGPMEADALARKLALTAPDRYAALEKRLAAMLRDGQLLQNRRGGYVPAARADLIPGTVVANPDGYGFLRRSEERRVGK